jgi:DNA polymerase-3 subunit alpha
MQFAHLHLHTQYSLLDGANRLPDIIEQAKVLGQPAIAMTDHGNLHGAIEFYSAAKGIGVKPIIGCELYVSAGSRTDRRPKAQGGPQTHHLTVLAADMTGYKNLCRLSTLAYREGFYFKPRVDHELLERFSEGLIVLSGCLAGELNAHVETGDERGARSLLEFYARTFKDRFYLEVQPHALEEQRRLNTACAEMAKELGLPLVATNDCHYPTADDHFAQEVLMCVSTGKLVTDPDRIRHENVQLHLKSAQEMIEGFGAGTSWAEEAVRNSLAIVERCNLSFDFSKYHLPKFSEDPPEALIEIMARQARTGLGERIETFKRLKPEWCDESKTAKLCEEYSARLELEITLIGKMGFAGYFLVVSDFIVWAKNHNIPVGPGRGSAAGSLVAYALRITEVDPLEHKLLFERFLNPERVSMPDIDVDFCIYGRDSVIKYVVEKYGAEMVAQISTFGTLKAKAAIKDVGRALGLSFAETNKVAELVPAPRQGFDFSLTEAMQMEPRLKEYAAGPGKELIQLALKLEGLTRHSSTHAAGVVIGDQPLMDLVPLMRDKDENEVTQYSMKYVEKVGLVKFDFLGLKTLTVIHTALDIIERERGLRLVLEELPLQDSATYKTLCSGNTIGVFQLESGGITEMTMRLKPNCFNDLVAILALYRPGPLDAGMVDHYIDRKHGRQKVAYMHPLMEPILADTFGIILYQEQIMQLAQALAGYSLAEADILRKAMGKKNPEEMAKQKDRFISGAVALKVAQDLAAEIFSQMETFARYGFNRSHSAAYAMVSFQTAYLKTHYPVEFMASLMSHEMDDSDKTLKNIAECRKQNIRVLPPDVNESNAGFTARDGCIRFGLAAVKGIGEKAVAAIVAERDKGGQYRSCTDLVSRVDPTHLNRRVLEGLIKCGAFDFSKVSRRGDLENLERNMLAAQREARERNSNQMSLFGPVGEASSGSRGDARPGELAGMPTQPVIPEWPVNQKLAFEREALGFYVTGHPLEKFKPELKKLGIASITALRERGVSGSVRTAGVVTALKLKNTKKGDRYASFAFEDATGTIDTLVWPDTYRQFAAMIVADEPVVIDGRLDVSDERCTLIVEKLDSLAALRDRAATQGILRLTTSDKYEERLTKLVTLFERHTGRVPVRLSVEIDSSEVSLALKGRDSNPITVVPSEQLCDEVEQLFGRPVLFFA